MKNLTIIFRKYHRIKYIGILLFCILLTNFLWNCSRDTKKQPGGEKIMNIKKEIFGQTSDGIDVYLYTLTNKKGAIVKITNYGGIVTSLIVQDKEGNMEDIVLGFDNLIAYLESHPYFGSIVGRYGNRIANGKFEIDGVEYQLAKNNEENHLHGGEIGFDKVIWDAKEIENDQGVGLELFYLSKDMEEGYPGNLSVTIIYFWTNDNELKINYKAETDRVTHVNLTHHSYFNLTACKDDVLNHEMMIDADRYTVVNEELIPTGELRDIGGTDMDFRTPETIGPRIENVEGGYDHNYVLNNTTGDLALVAEVYEPESGRLMEVFTTEPGVQFYTGNFLDGSITGKDGKVYKKHYGFCLETQHFPDSPNQPSFPSTLLYQGEKYSHLTIYKFSTK